jgi:hypothetical protein
MRKDNPNEIKKIFYNFFKLFRKQKKFFHPHPPKLFFSRKNDFDVRKKKTIEIVLFQMDFVSTHTHFKKIKKVSKSDFYQKIVSNFIRFYSFLFIFTLL